MDPLPWVPNWVELINHTALKFPPHYTDFPPPQPPGQPSTAGDLPAWNAFWFGEQQRHRFRLEVRIHRRFPWGLKVTRARIALNGQVADMTPAGSMAGSQLWLYDSPNECQPLYVYKFAVNYKIYSRIGRLFSWGTTDDAVALLPPDLGQFVAPVSNWGQFSWYVPGSQVSTGDGYLALFDYAPTGSIYIQNLTNKAISVTAPTLPAGPRFNVTATWPPSPLACGQSLPIVVVFDQTAGDGEDQLVIEGKDPGGHTVGQFTIHVSGLILGA